MSGPVVGFLKLKEMPAQDEDSPSDDGPPELEGASSAGGELPDGVVILESGSATSTDSEEDSESWLVGGCCVAA